MTIKQIKQAWPAIILPAFFLLALMFIVPAGMAQDKSPAAAPVGAVTASPMDISRAPVHETTVTKTTHPALKLTPDKSEIIRLDERVQSLIVGNPTHVNVLLDNAQTLILVPREPGATHFTALGKDGKIIMQRHVIVGSPAKKYVRIRRSCMNAGGGECEDTSVYYCPDMCHRVSIMRQDQGEPETSAAASGNTGSLPMPDTTGEDTP